MTEQLSRVRSRQKQYKGEELSAASRGDASPSVPQAPGQKRKPAVAAAGTLSRKERLARRRGGGRPEEEGRQPEGEETPSRTQTYPSERIRFSKMFVNSLSVLFLMLLAFLLYWGIEGAPPLRELFQ
ncbi:hypothetical protein [Paenibacillus piscarius]|uniref:hypothetical protein n=1 Tax=Paenibacillus piscarius TaxID=1089681 RepID=UPI001EE8D124|nr:hypothetical protein [Paenibacillus piscarius]